MATITDRESLRRWLKDRPQEICVLMAARAALRVYPTLLHYGIGAGEERQRMLLAANRALLTSAAAAIGPAAGLKDRNARAAARFAASATHAATEGIARPAARAAHASAYAAASSADAESFAASATAAAHAAANSATARAADARAAAGTYSDISKDASQIDDEGGVRGNLLRSRLWHSNAMPEKLAADWEAVLATPGVRSGQWRFWIDWYEGFLTGEPLDWGLQREIALIPNEDWEKGAEHVAEKIAKIELKFRTSVAPNFVRDDEADVFRLGQEPALPEDVLGFVCERIETALQNALDAATNNGLSETSYEAVTIRRALERHRSRPSLLATGFFDACLSFSTTIGERYPEDTSLINLKNALWVATEQVCEISEPAREQCARLATLSVPEPLTQADRDQASRVPDELVDLLDAEAEGALRDAAETIASEADPSKSVRARFTQWVTTVSIWIDLAKKGDARAQWLASVVERLARWWPNDDP